MLQGDSQRAEEEKMENKKGKKECRVESRGFGTLFWERGYPPILSETKNPPLCNISPSWLGKNPQKDTTSFTKKGKFKKKHIMRFIDLKVTPGSVWVYTSYRICS